MAGKTQYVALQLIIHEHGKQWQKRLGLSHYEVEHAFLETNHADDDDGGATPAECKPQWQYLRARIEWYLPTIITFDDVSIERAVLHELVHVLLAPEQENMKPSQSAAMELSTEMVARALWRAYHQETA